MQLFAGLALALFFAISFVSPSLAHTHQGQHHARRHVDLARRSPGEIGLYKRFDGARFTFYAVGLGACGITNGPGDPVVALSAVNFDKASSCFQSISITANGKTTSATIVDQCPGCPDFGLDLSQGLFGFFADISVGTLSGSWEYGSGGSSPASSSSPPSLPTTSVDIPATSLLASQTTSQSPSTTTSGLPTSSSSSNSTTISSGTSSLSPTQTTTGVVSESAGPIPDGSVLASVNMVLVEAGRLLVACLGSQ